MKGAQLLAALYPSAQEPKKGAQKEGNMKGTQREPSFLAADHPSDPGAQKGNMKGANGSLDAEPRPTHPTREPRKKKNMKAAQPEPTFLAPSFFAAAHPTRIPERRKHEGSQNEPSFLAAAYPSDPGAQKGNMKGAQRKPSFLAAAAAKSWAPFMFPFWGVGWVGWVGRGQGARRPSCFLSGLLSPFVLSSRMDGPRS
ncbi:unnamed protein product [Symbiodinium microadriaticum]|nr:unnamed protein product [Symbiodinium microadriaticum]